MPSVRGITQCLIADYFVCAFWMQGNRPPPPPECWQGSSKGNWNFQNLGIHSGWVVVSYPSRAFSSEVDTGSGEENASKQKD